MSLIDRFSFVASKLGKLHIQSIVNYLGPVHFITLPLLVCVGVFGVEMLCVTFYLIGYIVLTY